MREAVTSSGGGDVVFWAVMSLGGCDITIVRQ